MEQQPGTEPQRERQKLKKMGRRALIINIVFFLILFGGMFLVPYNALVAAVVIVVAFVASMLYIYLF